MGDAKLHKIDFTSLSPEILTELGEDFVRALSIPNPMLCQGSSDKDNADRVSKVVSRARTSPTGLSSRDAMKLAKTFRKAMSTELNGYPTWRPWYRLYAHALLRGSDIFPNVKLCDESPDYEPLGFMDIWKGNYRGDQVCIKAIRIRDTAPLEEIKKVYCREVKGSKRLPHPNVLTVIGISKTLFPLCILSPWMPDGNIVQYIQTNKNADRLILLAEACDGLSYLHGLDILHGCIAPGNILITRDGNACLGDFGITTARRWLPMFKLGTIRYMAPERLGSGDRANLASKESDVYSFAMTSFTVITGVSPFDGIHDYDTLTSYIRSGERPPRPRNQNASKWLRGGVWNMITTGWSEDPKKRWEVLAVCELFSTLCPREAHTANPGRQRCDPDPETGGLVDGIGQRPEPGVENSVNEIGRWRNDTGLEVESPAGEAGQRQCDPELDVESPVSEIGRRRHDTGSKVESCVDEIGRWRRDPGSEVERLVNEMDKHLENRTLSGQERLRLLNKFCKTCSQHCIIPKSMHVPDCSGESVEIARGGFANVSRATYKGHQVAIKVVRVYTTSDLGVIFSRFCREGVVWRHLRHTNILPLIGVTVSNCRFAMVSAWMENGNINEFIERDKHVNRVELLVDIANGLKYMHGLSIVHGDLKGANILINKNRRACIADFGLTTITGVVARATVGGSVMSNDTVMSFTAGGTYRWMSPELLDPERFGIPQSEDNRPTRQSDCYALGMVIYEVLCGHRPYVEIGSEFLAISAITEGVRPKKPEGATWLRFSDDLWRTIELCWLEDRNARPDVEDILSCLNVEVVDWYMREF